MFGHNDDSQQNNQDMTSSVLAAAQGFDEYHPGDSSNNTVHPDPGATSMVDSPAFAPSAPPLSTTNEPPKPAASHTSITPAAGASTTGSHNELLSIKQEVLQHLSPLVGHIDQSPEEKFRTIMMMIQASDDQSMIKSAYESAKLIPDEKIRAQALLDIINEINYFTQQQHQPAA